jgi:Na+-transporting NADH:ubiquinone oxidoreductase subunit B
MQQATPIAFYRYTRRNVRFVMRGIILASLPAAGIGLWALGNQILTADPTDSPGMQAGTALWQLGVLDYLGLLGNPQSAPASALLGLLLFAPTLAVALAVSRAWVQLFSQVRSRPIDPAWAVTAWLFALLLPAGVPLYLVVLGLSFGLVFGCYVFGGTGRYLVNPALLGVVFLLVAYPAQFTSGTWVPGTALATGWEAVVNSGPDESGLSWLRAFFGADVGAFGTPSAAACGIGALLLIVWRIASWRTIIAAFAGLAVTSLAFAGVPWYWQPVLGSFAFVAVFIATDPSTMALTVEGRWLQGALFGSLTAILRMLNPEHPEGTLFALLLATLFTPTIDHLVVRRNIRRRQKLNDHQRIAS